MLSIINRTGWDVILKSQFRANAKSYLFPGNGKRQHRIREMP
jgi:hypothetical protein